jgi:hypothetical protein
MSMQAISPVVSSQASGAQASGNNDVSDLVQLEQNVRNTESSYRKNAKKNGLSESEIENRITEYDQLIAQIEQQIRQAKQSEKSKTVQQHKTGAAAKVQNSELSVAALKDSYLTMPIPSMDASSVLAVLKPTDGTAGGVTPQKLDGNV